MAESIQPIQKLEPVFNKINLKPEEKQLTPPKASPKETKDKFIKKENNSVRNGAIAGASIGILVPSLWIVKNRTAIKNTLKSAENIGFKPSKLMLGCVTAAIISVPAKIGAGVGSWIGGFVKLFSKDK